MFAAREFGAGTERGSGVQLYGIELGPVAASTSTRRLLKSCSTLHAVRIDDVSQSQAIDPYELWCRVPAECVRLAAANCSRRLDRDKERGWVVAAHRAGGSKGGSYRGGASLRMPRKIVESGRGMGC
jgi:hypothetical protein